MVCEREKQRNCRKRDDSLERETYLILSKPKFYRGEAVLRKHLRTFEENQISNIIRRTKGKRTLKIHQFYSAEKYPKGYAEISKTILPQLKTAKTPSFSTKNLQKKNKKMNKISKFFENIFDGLR